MIRFYYNSNWIGPYQEDFNGFDKFENFNSNLTYPKKKLYNLLYSTTIGDSLGETVISEK